MIDIHCHILPGVDDGPSDIDGSIKMARIAVSNDIQKIVATPHVNNHRLSYDQIISDTNRLNLKLDALDIPLEILPGAEVVPVLTPEEIATFPINHTKYVLIEFPLDYMPQNAQEIIFNLVINGLKPIIAHPERNQAIIKKPDKLFNLLDSNVYVQITADSISGAFGRDVQKSAIRLLKKRVVDVIASDAHSHSFRTPNLSKGLKKAISIIGRENAMPLVLNNPEAIINGHSICKL